MSSENNQPPQKPKLSVSEMAVISEKLKKFDPNASEEDCIKDLRAVQEEFPLKYITRNFYRANGKYSDSTWNQYYGTFLEFRRQAGLELSRHQHQLEIHIAKHASVDNYRKFYTEEVLPYHNKYSTQDDKGGRWKTLLIGSDFHDKDADPFVLSTFLDVALRVQPEIVILNGDILDLPEFSKYNVDPRLYDILGRFQFAGNHIFGAVRRACPNAQIDMIIGNHEWRLMKHLADKSPHMRTFLGDLHGMGLAEAFKLDEYGINLICKIDFEAWNKGDREKELRKNYKTYFDAYVASHFMDLSMGMSGTSGHTHKPLLQTFTNLVRGKCSWMQTGCISQTEVDYTEHKDNYINSFGMAHIDTLTKSVSQEHFLIPKDHVVIHGKRYVRPE